MAHSLARLHVHLVFSTKHRQPLIRDAVRDALHGFMSGVLKKLECSLVIVNSVEDHAHLLFDLNRSVPLSKVVEDLKRASSRWLKTQDSLYAGFGWQTGYGAFAVSETNLDAVRKYIRRQREHHQRNTFQTEYRSLLIRNGITFDEHQLWD
jgi:REP element-mobilizing transposase RayT